MQTDVELLQGINGPESENLSLLLARHSDFLHAEMIPILRKWEETIQEIGENCSTKTAEGLENARDDAREKNLANVFDEVIDLIVTNAPAFKKTNGSVVEWLRECVRVAGIYWLCKMQTSPETENRRDQVASRFKLIYKEYPNELLQRMCLLCPMKGFKPRRRFFNLAPRPRDACTPHCHILWNFKQRATWKEIALLLEISGGTINKFARRCRALADDLMFNRLNS